MSIVGIPDFQPDPFNVKHPRAGLSVGRSIALAPASHVTAVAAPGVALTGGQLLGPLLIDDNGGVAVVRLPSSVETFAYFGGAKALTSGSSVVVTVLLTGTGTIEFVDSAGASVIPVVISANYRVYALIITATSVDPTAPTFTYKLI